MHPGWRAAGCARAGSREFDSFNDFFLLKMEQVLQEQLCALGTLPTAVPGGCRGSARADDVLLCTCSERGGCELGFQTGEQQLHLKACKTLIKKMRP